MLLAILFFWSMLCSLTAVMIMLKEIELYPRILDLGIAIAMFINGFAVMFWIMIKGTDYNWWHEKFKK